MENAEREAVINECERRQTLEEDASQKYFSELGFYKAPDHHHCKPAHHV